MVRKGGGSSDKGGGRESLEREQGAKQLYFMV